MLFNSVEFLFLFLPIVLVSFNAVRRIRSSAGIWLLVVASFLFYGAWDSSFLPIFLASIICNHFISMMILKLTRFKSSLMFVGIVGNLCALAYFKYANFAIGVFEHVTGLQFDWSDVALPIGISFFTFQQIAYLVDVTRGETHERSFVRYALFNSFFPHLIAGPITHHKEMMTQFSGEQEYPLRDISFGLTLFIVGLAKKVLIADNIAVFASAGFDAAADGSHLATRDAWIATIAYSLQIYFDFSAYSDMAVGLGKMFGINFPINFASPYKAMSISDFWRRWHISLSRFLRDYLYIPLGGSRVSAARVRMNLLTTMVLGGLWHGAGWNYVIWGAMHGGFLLAHHAWSGTRFSKRVAQFSCWPATAWLLTIIAVSVAWVPFRAKDLPTTLAIWRSMLVQSLEPAHVFAFGDAIIWILAVGAIAIATPNVYQIIAQADVGLPSNGYPATFIKAKPPNKLWFTPFHALTLSALFVYILLKLSNPSEFIYFQF